MARDCGPPSWIAQLLCDSAERHLGGPAFAGRDTKRLSRLAAGGGRCVFGMGRRERPEQASLARLDHADRLLVAANLIGVHNIGEAVEVETRTAVLQLV